MAIQDKRKLSLNRFKDSVSYAFSGISQSFKDERNLSVQLAAGVLVILAGFFFNITKSEWLVILVCIGLVLSLELVNTSIERTVDLFCENKRHPLAKYAKDAAAGAVLIFALTSVIIGLIIFLPYLISYLN